MNSEIQFRNYSCNLLELHLLKQKRVKGVYSNNRGQRGIFKEQQPKLGIYPNNREKGYTPTTGGKVVVMRGTQCVPKQSSS